MTHRLLSKQSAAHTEQSHGTNTRTNTHKIINNKHLKEHTRKTLTPQVGVPASVTHRPLPEQSAAHNTQSHYTHTCTYACTNTRKFTSKHLKEHTRKTLTGRHASESDTPAIARAVSGAHRTFTVSPVEAG